MASVRKPNVRASSTKRSRGLSTGLILSLVVALIVTLLLVTEQVALLYVLATLGIAALLLVVAFASFGEARAATESAPLDDSASIADRTASPTATRMTDVANADVKAGASRR